MAANEIVAARRWIGSVVHKYSHASYDFLRAQNVFFATQCYNFLTIGAVKPARIINQFGRRVQWLSWIGTCAEDNID